MDDIENRAAFGLTMAQRLILKEGVRLTPYADPEGKGTSKVTIGVGANLDEGISLTLVMCLLAVKLAQAFADLDKQVKWWRAMPEPARLALAEMSYMLGWSRLRKFKKMLAALKAGDFDLAASEELDSKLPDQVGERAFEIAALFQQAAGSGPRAAG